MHLFHRTAQPGDMDRCAQLLPDAFECDEKQRLNLPQVWKAWLSSGQLQAAVIEDRERESGRSIIAFGCSVFVDDRFVERAAHTLSPPLSLHIESAGLSNSSVLNLEQIRKANSEDGLNVLVLHIGWETGSYSETDVRRIKDRLIDAFFYAHGGYYLKDIIQEVYSEDEMRRGIAAGLRLRTDYSNVYAERNLSAPPSDRRPYLIGVRRDEVEEGSHIARNFIFSSPRFHFRPGQQDLLKRSLTGESDEEIASSLCISVAAVHKRWRSIYDRVTDQAPGLFRDSPPTSAASHRRGSEKRRHLLGYLRDHPEELRPVQSASWHEHANGRYTVERVSEC